MFNLKHFFLIFQLKILMGCGPSTSSASNHSLRSNVMQKKNSFFTNAVQSQTRNKLHVDSPTELGNFDFVY